MSKQVLTLGGKEFEIGSLNIKKSRVWRKIYGEKILAGLDLMDRADEIELTDLGQVLGLVKQLGRGAVLSMDVAIEAAFDYSPTLQVEREWIEENATDEEMMGALWACVRLAYPFLKLMGSDLNLGRLMAGTSKNLPKASGK